MRKLYSRAGYTQSTYLPHRKTLLFKADKTENKKTKNKTVKPEQTVKTDPPKTKTTTKKKQK